MDTYFRERRSLAGLFLVMDVRHPLTEFDSRMLAWADSVGCPVHVLLTKADKLSRGKAAATRHSVVRALGPDAGVQLFSALNSTGVDEARSVLDGMLGRDTRE
jgi:GTP-binding protein